MAAEWYYTTNKQQMGPVSWDELRQLASKDLLRPDDLVWTEGMAEWVKAVRQDGLFQVTTAPTTSTGVTKSRAPADEAAPPRKSSARKRIDEELDEIDDEERRDRRKSRKGSGAGLKIGLVIGGVVLVVLVLGCALAIVVAIVLNLGGGRAPAGPRTYQLALGPNGIDERRFNFQGGQRVTVTVATNRAGAFQPVVTVQVLQRGRALATSTSNRGDQNINFVAPANDSYVVRVQNAGPGIANSRVDVR